MPRYVAGRGNLQRKQTWSGFQDHKHLVQWLTKQHPHDELYDTHIRKKAQEWLDERSTPPVRLSKRALRKIATSHPLHLAADVMTEARQHHKGEDIGGGIIEGLHTLGSAVWNGIGGPKIMEWLGHKPYEERRIPQEAQIFARATEVTYDPIDERPDTVYGLVRMKEYDNDRFSVWKEPNGSVLVTLHGTKMNMHDLGQDLAILGGKTNIRSPDVEAVIERLASEGFEIDIAAHSLATQYISNLPESTQEHIDEIYMFNPASSPFMDTDYLNRIANNDNFTYFINQSDLVSNGIWQKMNKETVDRSYIGAYKWSPLAAHSISQWSQGLSDDNEEEIAKEYHIKGLQEKEGPAWYRAHLEGGAKNEPREMMRERRENLR